MKNILLENKTKDIIEIDWNGSSINGSPVFLDGQKYIDAGKQISSTILAPESYVRRAIYQTNKVSLSFLHWKIGYLNYPVEIILKIVVNNKAEFMILKLEKWAVLIIDQ